MTLNNPQVITSDYLEGIHKTLKAKYTVGQLEKGDSGTPHIQFFMNFNQGTRAAKIKKYDNKLHIEGVKINNGAHTYCMKEESRLEGPFEFGTKPVSTNNKTDWAEQLTFAKTG